MAISRQDGMSVREILRLIESKYPKGTERVTRAVVEEVFAALERHLAQMPQFDRSTRLRLRELYLHAIRGMKASDLYAELSSLVTDLDGSPRGADSPIARLERQLHDLRMMVTAPSDVDKKFRDLREQMESLREDMDGGRALLLDKQEDMLHKFLAADKKAFIIMPFQHDFDDVWQGGIKPACLETHYAPLRVDEVNLSSLITEDIERYSNMASVVVVDLTGNNPNVMFELGWSLAKNKKPIVICQGEHTSKVAFDVRGIRHISYENSWLGVESLKKKLKDFIVTTEQHTPSPKAKSRKKGASAVGKTASKG
jgi:hypothetical protein